jgi:hypothetical protein
LLHHLHYISIKILPIPTRHDIAEILLKVALNTKNQLINQSTNAPEGYAVPALLVTPVVLIKPGDKS